jgi:hypothetical protein
MEEGHGGGLTEEGGRREGLSRDEGDFEEGLTVLQSRGPFYDTDKKKKQLTCLRFDNQLSHCLVPQQIQRSLLRCL